MGGSAEGDSAVGDGGGTSVGKGVSVGASVGGSVGGEAGNVARAAPVAVGDCPAVGCPPSAGAVGAGGNEVGDGCSVALSHPISKAANNNNRVNLFIKYPLSGDAKKQPRSNQRGFFTLLYPA